ncbi:Extracellular matrix protein 3, partial [Globisporangium splendens]
MKRATRSALLTALLLVSSAWSAQSSSTIGFGSAFTNAASPFAITECDSACTSPGTVQLSLTLVQSGDLIATDTVYVSTRASSDAEVLSAAAPDDYTPLAASPVVFAPSENQKTVFVTIISDGVYEEDERFEAFLDSPSAGVTLPDSTKVAYISIQDGGDAGIFSFSSSSYSFLENAGLVKVKIATAVNNRNFVLIDSVDQVQFGANQREGLISFKIINDAVYEAKEFFYLEISSLLPTKASDPMSSVAKCGAPRSTVVFIADDGDAGVFNFASSYIYCREDNGSAVLMVHRDQGTSSTSCMLVSLVIATVGASGGSNATEGKSQAYDYLAKSEPLNWANGESKKTFAVKIFNNKKYESKTRAIKVKMMSVEGGASIGVLSESWMHVVDDRDAGTLSFKVPSYEVVENQPTVTVEIVRMGIPDPTGTNTYASGIATVNVATYAGTILPGKSRYDLAYNYGVVRARGCSHMSRCTAEEGVAYTAIQSTTVTFAEDEISKLVSISILDDNLFQAPDRVFKVILQNVAGGAHLGVDYEHPSEWYGYRDAYMALERRSSALLDNVGTIVTIVDDGDPAVIVAKASLSISEIGQHDEFQVRLNSQPSADVTISLTYESGLLALTSAALKFSTSNWNENQIVQVTAIPNNKSEGLHLSRVKFSFDSTDLNYHSPFRIDPQTTGCVLSWGIFTQPRGEYETGDAMHEYLWAEPEGVLTAPVNEDSIAVFIFDDDHAGVSIHPESIPHGSGANVPDNYVSVRVNGRNATVQVDITSEPTDTVRVSFVPERNSGVAVEPESFIVTPLNWTDTFDVQIVGIPSGGQADAEHVQFTSIPVFVTSKGDTDYDQSSMPMNYIFVQRFPPAVVLLDSSAASIREGAGENEQVIYSASLGSEPMHWEPSAGTYSPHEIVLEAKADTTLVFPPASSSRSGGASTITVASNSSQSTDKHTIKSVGVLRFNVHPIVMSSTGSSQVGSACLRIFRASGGENGGLGGVRVGVTTSLMTSSNDWSESLLRSSCTDTLENGGACSIMNDATSLPQFFPPGTTIDTISSKSDGETAVYPSQEFDENSNTYIPTSGWLEIDVTYALNKFLSEVTSESPPKAITFLVYSRSIAAFNYNGVDEVVLASKEYADSELRPELRITSSGTVNLALTASVAQSSPRNAKAAADGITSSKIGLSSTYALSAATYSYPWWQADLGVVRAIEDIIVTVKKRASSASLDDSKLKTLFWVFLSSTPLSSSNDGLTGFTSAKARADFAKQFSVLTRSFEASDAETITFRWHVNGGDGVFGSDRFIANFSTPPTARYVLLQVEGENSIMLNEVEIYQQAFASARVSIGGFMPSPSVARAGKNQLQLVLPGVSGDTPECDASTAICRRELLFTSGNWRVPQVVGVKVFDDAVAMGDHDGHVNHYPESADPDFNEGSKCDPEDPSGSILCKNTFFNDSGIKTLRILEDEENKIVLSTHKVGLAEGSGNFPDAPVFVCQAPLVPAFYRCSSSNTSLRLDADCVTECGTSFKSVSSTNWETRILNASALPLEAGSAWIMAEFPTDAKITSIDITIPLMLGAKYLKRFSLWWSSSTAVGDTSTPFVKITGFETIPFPLAIRGDLTDPNSMPPPQSHLSRMHLYGESSVIQIQLTSEPVADVSVSAIVEAKNSAVEVYDASNASDTTSVVIGSSYESGNISSFTVATAITFTPTNWNVPQNLTFLAVDDNFFNGNQTFAVSLTVASEDTVVATTPYQTLDNQQLKQGFAKLPASLSYTKAAYIVSSNVVTEWPHHHVPTWTSPTGSVEAAVVDDDLPGVTISASEIQVPESGPSGNYSVYLDSAPFEDVVVKISYEQDATLLQIEPLELTFTMLNWYEPQFVFIHPVANDVYDGEQPYTVGYEMLIPKAKQPEFSRVAVRLKCLPSVQNAICSSTFSASTLVSTLYRMLASNEFTTPSGKAYPKLSLGPVSDVMYVVNSTRAACVDSSGECITVWMDFAAANTSDQLVLEKLNGYVDSDSLKTGPFYAELMTTEQQYPADLGATIAVWIFIGFCGLCVTAVGVLFIARLVRAKRSHVTPAASGGGDADGDDVLRGMALTDLIHATVPTSPVAT